MNTALTDRIRMLVVFLALCTATVAVNAQERAPAPGPAPGPAAPALRPAPGPAALALRPAPALIPAPAPDPGSGGAPAATAVGVCGGGGENDCFTAHGTPGCTVAECCAAVCAVDAFCCETQWDQTCVNEALKICGTCGGAGAGSCFESNGTPACSNSACCTLVCAADPFCCDTSWDNVCATAAQNMCACGGADTGSCFTVNPGPSCSNAECCEAVCAQDPFCCNVAWDNFCVGTANQVCALCGGEGAGSCFVADDTPSCNEASCCNAVCAADPFCCEVEWDQVCVDEAFVLCVCGGTATGSCFTVNEGPSCNSADCCNAVCASDPFCCDTQWDQGCVDAANIICATCGGAGAGSCFVDDGIPACNDPACCEAVCAQDPFCCEVSWDNLCAEAATTLCMSCGGPGTGSCFSYDNVSPSCTRLSCCEEVCAADPFCCATAWDDLCVDEAYKLCCPADIAPASDGNASVDILDLLDILDAWGECEGANCPADVAPQGSDGFVDINDLLFILADWGACD